MIFIASDAASLSKSLGRWEAAEYVFSALVALACAGEGVAEFTNWFTGGIKERKERLAKLSTLLLIAALGFELICVVRTNQLSGGVIGFLGDEAGGADWKAKEAIKDSSTALSQADNALAKAGHAADSLGKAENEANKAQAASSNALALAKGARQEADSFEADIKSAETQAAEAESHLAEAAKRANELTARLNRLTTPRSLPHPPQLVALLTPFKGTEYLFTGTCGDEECFQLVSNIDELLKLSGWKRGKSPPMHLGIPQFVIDQDLKVWESVGVGTSVWVEAPNKELLDSMMRTTDDQQPEYVRAALALNLVLTLNISPPENMGRKVSVIPLRDEHSRDNAGSPTGVKIDVGRKPQ